MTEKKNKQRDEPLNTLLFHLKKVGDEKIIMEKECSNSTSHYKILIEKNIFFLFPTILMFNFACIAIYFGKNNPKSHRR